MIFIGLAFLCAYLLGSLSGAIILCRIFKQIDIRSQGSGNAGTANTFRVLGWKLGVAVLVWDIAKGALSVLLSHRLFGLGPVFVLFAGLVAVLGHIFPLFHEFRGGKGVATAGGVFLLFYLTVSPCCTSNTLALWGLLGAALTSVAILVTTGYASLANLAGALVFLAVEIVSAWQSGNFGRLLPVGIVVPGLVYMHRKNIRRLIQGRENRFERAMIFKKYRYKNKDT